MSTTTFILGPDGEPVSSQHEAAETPPTQLRGATLPANPSISDAAGSTLVDPGLRGGWTYADGMGRPTAQLGRYGMNRDAERTRCRSMFFLNPLLQAALNIATSFLLGDTFSYGEVPDKSARLMLDEFWQANNLGTLMSERWLTEFFLDGENATVFPQGDADPGPDSPARIAFLDLSQNVTVQSDTARGTVASDMVTRLTLRQNMQDRNWEPGEFVWTANNALWNDPRGFPLVSGAVDAAMAYIALANHRLNIHEVQQRIVGIYTAMLNPEDADGGLANWRRKAAAFKAIPPKGAVVPLIVKPGYTDKNGVKYDGVTEKLEFPKPASGAADAASDMGVFLRLVGLCLGGLPEHWLGEGGTVTRTTASEMSLPAVRLAQMRQATVRNYLDRLMRTELERRRPGALYTVYTTTTGDGGLTRKRSRQRLPASRLEFPWNLPTITEESLETTLRVVTAMADRGWISDQTGGARLGADVPTEVELMAAAGRTFGQARIPPTPTTGGDPNAPRTPPPTDDAARTVA